MKDGRSLDNQSVMMMVDQHSRRNYSINNPKQHQQQQQKYTINLKNEQAFIKIPCNILELHERSQKFLSRIQSQTNQRHDNIWAIDDQQQEEEQLYGRETERMRTNQNAKFSAEGADTKRIKKNKRVEKLLNIKQKPPAIPYHMDSHRSENSNSNMLSTRSQQNRITNAIFQDDLQSPHGASENYLFKDGMRERHNIKENNGASYDIEALKQQQQQDRQHQMNSLDLYEAYERFITQNINEYDKDNCVSCLQVRLSVLELVDINEQINQRILRLEISDSKECKQDQLFENQLKTECLNDTSQSFSGIIASVQRPTLAINNNASKLPMDILNTFRDKTNNNSKQQIPHTLSNSGFQMKKSNVDQQQEQQSLLIDINQPQDISQSIQIIYPTGSKEVTDNSQILGESSPLAGMQSFMLPPWGSGAKEEQSTSQLYPYSQFKLMAKDEQNNSEANDQRQQSIQVQQVISTEEYMNDTDQGKDNNDSGASSRDKVAALLGEENKTNETYIRNLNQTNSRSVFVPLIPLLKYPETTQISLNSKVLDLSSKNKQTKKIKNEQSTYNNVSQQQPPLVVASRKKQNSQLFTYLELIKNTKKQLKISQLQIANEEDNWGNKGGKTNKNNNATAAGGAVGKQANRYSIELRKMQGNALMGSQSMSFGDDVGNNNSGNSSSSTNNGNMNALKGIDNSLVNEIANQRKFKSSQIIMFLLLLLIVAFCVQSVIFITEVVSFCGSQADKLNRIQSFKELSVIYGNQTASSLFLFEIANQIIVLNGDSSNGSSHPGSEQIIEILKDSCNPNQVMFSESLAANYGFIDGHNEQFDLALYTDGVLGQNPNGNLLDSYMQMAYEAIAVCQSDERSINAMLSLVANILESLEASTTILKSEFESFNSSGDHLRDFFFRFIIIVIVLCSLTSFLSLPILQNINNYKEKVLLLVSRINMEECLAEVSKLETCLTALSTDYTISNHHNSWISKDFHRIFNKNKTNNLGKQQVIEQNTKPKPILHKRRDTNRSRNLGIPVAISQENAWLSPPQQNDPTLMSIPQQPALLNTTTFNPNNNNVPNQQETLQNIQETSPQLGLATSPPQQKRRSSQLLNLLSNRRPSQSSPMNIPSLMIEDHRESKLSERTKETISDNGMPAVSSLASVPNFANKDIQGGSELLQVPSIPMEDSPSPKVIDRQEPKVPTNHAKMPKKKNSKPSNNQMKDKTTDSVVKNTQHKVSQAKQSNNLGQVHSRKQGNSIPNNKVALPKREVNSRRTNGVSSGAAHKKQLFSSLIQTNKLNILRSVIWMLILSISGVIYFCLAIFLSWWKSEAVDYPMDLYSQAVLSVVSMSTMIPATELVVRKAQLEQTIVVDQAYTDQINYDLLKDKGYLSAVTSGLSTLGMFLNSLSSQRLGALELQAQLTSDVCLMYPSDIICQNIDIELSSSLSGVLKQGILTTLNIYNTLIQSYHAIYYSNADSNTQTMADTLKNYSLASEFQYMIILGFRTPLQFLSKITSDVLLVAAVNALHSLRLFVVLYFAIGGTLIALIWVVICSMIRKTVEHELAAVSLALTCIPLHKLTEDATFQMLKTIKAL